MIYININNGTVSTDYPIAHGARWDWNWTSRNDWDTMEHAENMAAFANEAAGSEKYMATDAGQYCSPRYDVIAKPAVGDDVSYAFNGDYYPDGQIKSISKTMKVITTTTGDRFYRVRETGCWKMNGTWSMVGGHIERQNPHF